MLLVLIDEIKGEGNFYVLMIIVDGVYVICNGDDIKGWVFKVMINDGKVGFFEWFIVIKEVVEVDVLVGIIVSLCGEIVVG